MSIGGIIKFDRSKIRVVGNVRVRYKNNRVNIRIISDIKCGRYKTEYRGELREFAEASRVIWISSLIMPATPSKRTWLLGFQRLQAFHFHLYLCQMLF